MTPKSVAAIAAIVASVGLSAFSPAMAQDTREVRQHRMLDFRAGAAGRFEFAQFSCAPKAADRMERRFDRLADRLKLTDDQKKLYDAFMTSALTAQTALADKCGDMRPAKAADATTGDMKRERPDLLTQMETRMKFDAARLDAMTAVFPDFKAFYASLSEAQQGDLFPMRGHQKGGKHPDGKKSGMNSN